MARHAPQILALAKRGAEVRLQHLLHEARQLVRLFPQLKDAFGKDGLPVSSIVATRPGRLTRGGVAPRRQAMSAAARKAASQRMKRHWAAKKRKAKKA